MTTIRTLAEHDAYFQQLGAAHTSIKQVVIGDSEEILTRDRSELDYPVLWIETPQVQWELAQPSQAFLNGAFVVLINTVVDSQQRERYVLDSALQIAQDLIAIIRQDAENDHLDLPVSGMKSDAILGYGVDNDYGWRTTYQIRIPIRNCAPTNRINTDCPAGAMARFSWENRNAGDFTDLVITPQFTPDAVEYPWQTIEYTALVDDNPPVISSDPPTNLGPGNHLRLILMLASKDCTLYASAFFSNAAAGGQSVPFVLTKTDYI